MSLRDELPPNIISVTGKALDIHRQSLIRRLSEQKMSDVARQRIMQEIEDCSQGAAMFRAEEDALLAEREAS